MKAYIEKTYPVIPLHTKEASQIIVDNIMYNQVFREKLPQGSVPIPYTYMIKDTIFLGIDIVTGYFHVRGSKEIYNELFAYRGLDEKDLNNYFLVAEYILCCGRETFIL